MSKIIEDVIVGRISLSIEMLKKNVTDSSIEALMSALEKLQQEPDNYAHLEELNGAFNALGIAQGAVLTYAPYVSDLLLDDIFGEI